MGAARCTSSKLLHKFKKREVKFNRFCVSGNAGASCKIQFLKWWRNNELVQKESSRMRQREEHIHFGKICSWHSCQSFQRIWGDIMRGKLYPLDVFVWCPSSILTSSYAKSTFGANNQKYNQCCSASLLLNACRFVHLFRINSFNLFANCVIWNKVWWRNVNNIGKIK